MSLAITLPIALIVARAQDGAIGRGNDMPWHVPADFRFFKATTMGKPIIMGRKTFQSIIDRNGKPLPGRHSIVVSRQGYDAGAFPVVKSLEEALQLAQDWATANNADEIIIGGGAEIFKLSLPYATKAYVTEIPMTVPDADTWLETLGDNWRRTHAESAESCEFTVWEKI
jgi:dihydrofolate reductase